jgi:hypothetical protein
MIMKRFYLSICAVGLCLSPVFAQNKTENQPLLKLQSGEFGFNSLTTGEFSKAELAGWPSFNGNQYGVLILASNLSVAQQKEYKALGVEFLSAFKQGKYLVSVNQSVSNETLNSLNIEGLLPWSEEFKSLENFNDVPERASAGGQSILVNIHPFENISLSAIKSSVVSDNIAVMDERETYHFITIKTNPEHLDELVENEGVQYLDWVYEYGESENYTAATSHRVNYLSTDNTNGIEYEGQGVTVMLQDDGAVGPHIDRHGRETQMWAGSEGDHGDHVSGTILGAGNIDPRGKGQAPQADLFVYKAAPEYQGFDNIMADYFTHDIVITSTSYSNGCNAGYTALARTMDDQVQQRSALMHVFSAGNSGTSNCGYGAGNTWGNITGGHKVGKNVITVANLDNEDNIANSSSRGPAHDGRIKPDISATGSNVYSTIENYDYGVKSGTSMSCPGVSGSLAVLYSAFEDINGDKPEAGLMKSIVLNTADDLGVEGPDFIFGWGRINVRKAYEAIQNIDYQSGTLADGDSVNIALTIPANLHSAKIMVYWTDPEASVGASTALINDLDMTITDPNSNLLLPLILDPTPNASTLNNPAVPGEDHLNNVEQVVLSQPTGGVYNIKVKGFDVAQGPQKFFVTYWFEEEKITLTYPLGGESFVPFTSEKIRWDVSPDTGIVTIEYTPDNGATWNIVNNTQAANNHLDWSIPNIATGETRVRLTYAGQTVESENLSIIQTPSGLGVQYVCPDSIGLIWSNVSSATSYDVYRLGTKYMDSIGVSQNNTFVDYGVNPYSDFLWYSVSSNGPNSAEGKRAYAVKIQPGVTNCIIAIDAEVSAVSPSNGSLSDCFGDSISVSFTLTNAGTTLISAIDAEADFGGLLTNETFNIQLAPSADTLLTFNQMFVYPTGNTNLVVSIDLPNDGNSYNDSLASQIVPSSSNTVNEALWSEDFESFNNCSTDASCGEVDCNLANNWKNEENYVFDDIDWRVNSGETPSDFTGPTSDHTTGNSSGHYLYLEASGVCDEATALLLSPCIQLAEGGKPELVFWYNMRGPDLGSLHVDVFDGVSWTNDVMTPLIGNQGTPWMEQKADLSAFAGQTINLRFRGTTGVGYRSDIAIDDIGVLQPPVANFLPEVQNDGFSVNLTDLSLLADSMMFDLGDGTVLPNVPATYTYNQITVYNMTQEVYNDAGADTLTISLNTLSVDNPENQINIVSYPNPAIDFLYLQISDATVFNEMSVFSIDGTMIERRALIQDNTISIDLHTFALGSYFIELSGSQNAKIQFIKAK